MNRKFPLPRQLRRLLPGVLAAAPLWLLWPALRHGIESRMLLHMLLEFPLLLAGGWAAHHVCGRRAWLRSAARAAVMADWHGWGGATLLSIVTAAWMLPSLLDMALLSTAVALVKLVSWWLTGWLLAGSMRRMDPELQLFLFGNLAWMTASAGLLYVDTPARLCVNYLEGDQQQAGGALVIVALLLGLLALRQAMHPVGTVAPPRTLSPEVLAAPVVRDLGR